MACDAASTNLQLLFLLDAWDILRGEGLKQIPQVLFQILQIFALSPVVAVIVDVSEITPIRFLPIRAGWLAGYAVSPPGNQQLYFFLRCRSRRNNPRWRLRFG